MLLSLLAILLSTLDSETTVGARWLAKSATNKFDA